MAAMAPKFGYALPDRGPTHRLALGRCGEHVACCHLQALGYRVVGRNLRFTCGEIDLIAWDADVFCFIEVRSRAVGAYGDPLETIGAVKQARLIGAATAFLQSMPAPWPLMRFDALGIVWPQSTLDPPAITLVRDAFEA